MINNVFSYFVNIRIIFIFENDSICLSVPHSSPSSLLIKEPFPQFLNIQNINYCHLSENFFPEEHLGISVDNPGYHNWDCVISIFWVDSRDNIWHLPNKRPPHKRNYLVWHTWPLMRYGRESLVNIINKFTFLIPTSMTNLNFFS